MQTPSPPSPSADPPYPSPPMSGRVSQPAQAALGSDYTSDSSLLFRPKRYWDWSHSTPDLRPSDPHISLMMMTY